MQLLLVLVNDSVTEKGVVVSLDLFHPIKFNGGKIGGLGFWGDRKSGV
jgi:hypothetical protein